MKKLNQILREGVYDPGIFKAFFLAGGPGSGKTFVTRSAFGGTGLKLVNSDAAFERGLKKAGLSLKMPDQEEYFRNIVRAKAKMTTATQLDTYIQGRLGLVIDATDALSAYLTLVPLRQSLDELLSIGRLCRGFDVGLAGVGVAIRNVVGDVA